MGARRARGAKVDAYEQAGATPDRVRAAVGAKTTAGDFSSTLQALA